MGSAAAPLPPCSAPLSEMFQAVALATAQGSCSPRHGAGDAAEPLRHFAPLGGAPVDAFRAELSSCS
eukprot:7962826-Alexandrium_andersonii.AAC.1